MTTASDVISRVVAEFARRYGSGGMLLARAPGRVNLIGDHTDYNDGFVLPMAIDRAAYIAFRPRTDAEVHVHALDVDEDGCFTASASHSKGQGWLAYLRAASWALSDAGYALRGWDGVVAGDVPVGAGLSSSAALELATMRAFAASSSLAWDTVHMAQLAQRAENLWVGVNCGIMDQLISSAGKAGHAMLIDCRSLSLRAVPIPDTASVVVLDTTTRRELVTSAYNERRAQCASAAALFEVAVLRDVSLETFAERSAALPVVTMRRARHVITENMRTLAAADALTAGDLPAVGRLMNESHASLRDDFEVSRRALDTIVALAQEHPACFGARMTGAGFGGCAVALVVPAGAADFVRDVSDRFAHATALRPAVYMCTASAGASMVAS